MSPVRQVWLITALAVAGFLALRRLPDTHCALLHADHRPVVVDGLEFCGLNEEANFYRPRELRYPFGLQVEPPRVDGPRLGRLRLLDEDGRSLRDHQLALSHTRKVHLHLRPLGRSGYVHLHPEPQEDGSWIFEVPASVDLGGGAHVYVDFVPVRTGRPVLADAILPPGGVPSTGGAEPAVLTASFTLDETRAGRAAWLRFRLGRADGAPVRLRPLMGTLGHAVVLPADSAEAAMGYAHMHPSLEGGEREPNPSLAFRLRLPSPGVYEVWLHVDDGADRYLRASFEVTP